jgi:hypothetical protein
MKKASQLPGPADYASPPPPLKRPTMSDIKNQFMKSGSTVAVGFMGKLKETVENARDDQNKN